MSSAVLSLVFLNILFSPVPKFHVLNKKSLVEIPSVFICVNLWLMGKEDHRWAQTGGKKNLSFKRERR
jgi:hypothetical protein